MNALLRRWRQDPTDAAVPASVALAAAGLLSSYVGHPRPGAFLVLAAMLLLMAVILWPALDPNAEPAHQRARAELWTLAQASAALSIIGAHVERWSLVTASNGVLLVLLIVLRRDEQ